MGKIMNKAKRKLNKMENKAHEIKGKVEQKKKDQTTESQNDDFMRL